MTRRRDYLRLVGGIEGQQQHAEPFESAEAAWFWTMAVLVARRDGARRGTALGKVPRLCEPDDVVRALDRLYRQRKVDLQHARILRIYGERGVAPNGGSGSAAERADYRIWTEAMERLDYPLRLAGIVAGPARVPIAP